MTSSSKPVFCPYLKTIKLVDRAELVGFFLGTKEFHWLFLDELTIDDCPKMKVFTAGGYIAPQLKYVQTKLGKHSSGHGFNSQVTTTTTTGLH